MPLKLRPLSFKKNVNRYAEGSCLIEMGHTRVLCLASVAEDLPKWRKESGLGWVTAEYAMLPRATHTRSDRESVKGKVSGRTQEISRLVGRALRSVVDFKLLGPHSITLDCEVLQADGGTRCAAINGAMIALALACRSLMKEKKIAHWPLKDSVAAVSVGLFQRKLCLDLCYEEDSAADVDMNVVMTGKGEFVELQGTAEHRPFSKSEAKSLLDLAAVGLRKITLAQRAALKGVWPR
ncbi:MAG TPA: ribonuclease PH [bacterium]|nr:ribonuclease PH [bacterium]